MQIKEKYYIQDHTKSSLMVLYVDLKGVFFYLPPLKLVADDSIIWFFSFFWPSSKCFFFFFKGRKMFRETEKSRMQMNISLVVCTLCKQWVDLNKPDEDEGENLLLLYNSSQMRHQDKIQKSKRFEFSAKINKKERIIQRQVIHHRSIHHQPN